MLCRSDEEMRDLRCMSFTSRATSEILVAGLQGTMLVIDVNKGEIIKRVCASSKLPIRPDCCLTRPDSYHRSLHQDEEEPIHLRGY